ncbi:MAG: NADH-quinone oxidoreductase subunit L, partial [Beggiatoa sp.]|nr:NADH-quinone oxidoreductase subunit L [Beggiatoa sp.]
IGTLALVGFPGLSGFFSKDAIIEAVRHSELPGAGIAYLAVLCGVFVTSLYSFRLLFLVFHGQERLDHHTKGQLHESPRVVTGPLVALAVPSVLIGALTIGPMLFGNYFGSSIQVAEAHDVLARMREGYHGPFGFVLHGFTSLPFTLAVLGFVAAWVSYLWRPGIPGWFADRFRLIYELLVRKYGFDDFNDRVFAGGARGTGWALWQLGDVRLIDGLMVNGSARFVGWFSRVVRQAQSGYLYHYAFAMIIGLLCLLGYFVYGLGR